MEPTVGRIVQYRLTEKDAALINNWRTDWQRNGLCLDKPLGVQAHRGNYMQAGQIVPLLIVAVWPEEYGPGKPGVNGQAFMDGSDTLWVTSVAEGTENGQWQWPEIKPYVK